MKKILSILCILTITMIACQKTLVDEAEQKSSAILTRSADANATYYYWYKGEKIALTLNSNYVNVVVENDLAKSASTQSLAQSYSLIQEENERCGNIITLKLATKTVSSEYEKLVADLKQDERVKHVLPFS